MLAMYNFSNVPHAKHYAMNIINIHIACLVFRTKENIFQEESNIDLTKNEDIKKLFSTRKRKKKKENHVFFFL
jgi:hypothetical protein